VRLDGLRARLRAAYRLPDDCAVVFAPSGTDLEYVALACVAGLASGGIHNVLLGADEVGSGCIQSAHGRFFAEVTARGEPVTPGQCVAGLERVSLADVPVRCAEGLARSSGEIAEDIVREIALASGQGRHTLVHVVHGSKTGLILPELPEIDALLAAYGDHVSLVVDACQARITSEALHAYLDRGAIVFLTGSKFMGGPPFSGFAVVPPEIAERAGPLPQGMTDIFRRAEWPEGWPGRECLTDEDNLGLWLRLEAAIFELERFQALPLTEIERVIGEFQRNLDDRLVAPLGLTRVNPYPAGGEREAGEHPIAMKTLATIDTSSLAGAHDFEDAQKLHRKLALSGLRLGQPVRSVRTPNGQWGGTLRIGLSMPQIVEWSGFDEGGLIQHLSSAMGGIAAALVEGRRDEAA
jgi:hypothetical protein